MRYFLKIAYDGTDFHGWQRQPNAVSVQETIEEALSIICREKIEIVGAGRTDTGVHAREMFAHFDCNEIKDPDRFSSSLNKLVGNAISIGRPIRVKPDAHARFDAISRAYKYHIIFGKNPFEFKFSHNMVRKPDVEKMNEAASVLLETEDFTSFAKLHSDAKTNICKVSVARWEQQPDSDKIVFTIKADRFLRNMVRSVVGTLLEVGTGKININEFREIIDRKDRCAAGTSMPAKGLFLEAIEYPEEIFIR